MEPQPKSRRRKTTPKRKTSELESSYPKITRFLSPKNDTKPSTSETKFQPLDVTVTSNKRKKSRSSRQDSSTIVIPSYEKILADWKKFDEHKESVKLLDVFDEALLDDSLITYRFPESHTFSGELLDCKSLSFEELKCDFEKHLETLSGIMKGTVFSDRHESYKKEKRGEAICMDLKVSDSVAVFTAEQNEHLLDLITKNLDPEDKLVGYCFKVLWPELCFRIFIDHHGMEVTEAKIYLEKRPLDN